MTKRHVLLIAKKSSQLLKAVIKPACIIVTLFTVSTVTAAPSVEQVISELWQALSREPNQRPDIAGLKALFHENAMVFGGRQKNNLPNLKTMPAAEFIKGLDRISENGFYECEIFRTIDVFERFATAYSVVESRTSRAAIAPDFVGVNSIQLYKDDRQWKIISLYYYVGPKDLSVPAGTHRSGKCIN